MVGTAIGNLLGLPVEGYPRGSARGLFPDGTLDIEGATATGSADDDDLAQAIVLAEAATEGTLDIDDLGRRFWYWA
jgi:ADP-ribosylglycohydrolase